MQLYYVYIYTYIYTYPTKESLVYPFVSSQIPLKIVVPQALRSELEVPLSITWVLIKRLKNHYFAWWNPKNNDSVRLSKTSIFHGEFTDFWGSTTDFYWDWWSPTSAIKPLPGDRGDPGDLQSRTLAHKGLRHLGVFVFFFVSCLVFVGLVNLILINGR